MLAMFFSLLVFSSVLVSKAQLRLADDNTFQISVFSDLHYGENESTFGIPADKNSAALMRQVLSQEKPNSAHAKDTARRHLFRAELGVLYILQGQADPSNETGLSIFSFNEIYQRYL